MNKTPVLLCAALGLAWLVTGCETDSASGRTQEKSAVYAALKPWQKKYIDKGMISVGFTPDMVYMAVGRATTVEPKESPEGSSEVWTYNNFYPSADATNLRYNQNGDSQNNAGRLQSNGKGGLQAIGASRGGGAVSSPTGGVQGGSGEPAELQSYTFVVTFKKGVVSAMRLNPN